MPTPPTASDPSNGWEAVAPVFIREGRLSRVGVAKVTDWVNQLPPASALLDLGCGPGVPRSEPLHARGVVCAIDASPSLARAYHERFPVAQVACESAEGSALQEEVVRRVAGALKPGGRFLFTAPWQVCTWADNSTGRESVSLGVATYRELLAAAGLTLVHEHEDEGENHYYDTMKR